MVALIAKKTFPYAGRTIAIGERFDAPERDATILTLSKHAEAAPRHLARKDLAAETPQPEYAAVHVTVPKRQYRRRDLTVEPSE